MKKYLLEQGYKFKKDYNDMNDKQFTLTDSEYADGEYSTFSNKVMDMQETYSLFLKSFDTEKFRTTLHSILNSALDDGIYVSLGNSVGVEKQENGYMITMNFVTSGVPPESVSVTTEWADEFEITWVDENGNTWTT